ncbi:MAG: hypothetical protein KME38_28400 [Spirirestis rafaelensis WJT71-NPBG6]|nr:hypothetical protein [Spirirestis rafaelensis WJT71-NPBG6]
MEELTPTQNQALCLLAAGYDKHEVANISGITIRTLDRWRKNPKFDKLLKQAIRKTYDACIAELVSGSRDAARTLKSIISDSDVPSRVKVTAIQVLLTNASKVKDDLLEERLEAVEALLDADKNEDTTH